jgi:putative transposase
LSPLAYVSARKAGRKSDHQKPNLTPFISHHHTEGTGPIYQGRFKSFPIQEDNHYFRVCRYVERNALRARLVRQAENWRWSSLWQRYHKTGVPWLSDGPPARPQRWLQQVNKAETESELEALRKSVVRGAPYGDETWQRQTAAALGLQSALRRPGRPKKEKRSTET